MSTTHATGHIPTAGEHLRDLQYTARILAGLDAEGQGAAAYDHASHGCPFEDSEVVCPVGCDTPDNIANETAAFFGGVSDAMGAA